MSEQQSPQPLSADQARGYAHALRDTSDLLEGSRSLASGNLAEAESDQHELKQSANRVADRAHAAGRVDFLSGLTSEILQSSTDVDEQRYGDKLVEAQLRTSNLGAVAEQAETTAEKHLGLARQKVQESFPAFVQAAGEDAHDAGYDTNHPDYTPKST